MRRMRSLLALAPLLLTGCALLYPSSMTNSSGPYDGYELTCEDIEFSACQSLADQGAMLHRMSSTEPITTITIGTDGNGTVCSASGCAEIRSD